MSTQTGHDTKVNVVANQKGGVGKTTLTVNLAAAMAEVFPPFVPPAIEAKLRAIEFNRTGITAADLAEVEQLFDECEAQVLAVSTDPQASMFDWLEGVYEEMLQSAKPMPIDHAQQDHDPAALAALKSGRQYRQIFVDSPGWLPPKETDDEAGPGPIEKAIVRATLVHADLVILPIEPEELAFKPTKRTIEEVIEPLGKRFIVVINNWDPRDGRGDLEDTRDRVREEGWPLANTVIRRYKLHTSAPAARRLCTQYKSNRTATEASQDFYKLALEVTGITGGSS